MKSEDGLAMAALLLLLKARILRKLYGISYRYEQNTFFLKLLLWTNVRLFMTDLICSWVCVSVCVYVCMHVCVFVYVCVYVSVCVRCVFQYHLLPVIKSLPQFSSPYHSRISSASPSSSPLSPSPPSPSPCLFLSIAVKEF